MHVVFFGGSSHQTTTDSGGNQDENGHPMIHPMAYYNYAAKPIASQKWNCDVLFGLRSPAVPGGKKRKKRPTSIVARVNSTRLYCRPTKSLLPC